MTSLSIAGVTLACVLGGMLVGMILRSALPDHHLRDESKDVMKTVSGMMATLIVLVIGLLVSSAKSSFDAANVGLMQGGDEDHPPRPDAVPLRAGGGRRPRSTPSGRRPGGWSGSGRPRGGGA